MAAPTEGSTASCLMANSVAVVMQGEDARGGAAAVPKKACGIKGIISYKCIEHFTVACSGHRRGIRVPPSPLMIL